MLRMKYRSLGLTVLALAMLTTAACNRVHVTNVPAGVSDKEVALWFQATGATQTWAETGLNLTKAAISLHDQFPNEDLYQKVLAGLGKQAQFGAEASNFLKTVPQHFDGGTQTQLANYLDGGIAALDDATQVDLLQIKDQNTKNAVHALADTLRASLRTVFALVKPAGTPVPASLQGGK